MPSKHLILCLLSSVFSSIKVFSNESAFHIRWPKYWSFSISPTNECSRLISFRIDYFDLLAVQGTLKSLLQHHSLKASVLWCSAFLMVQLSRPYRTTGKTIVLTRWTFVTKVISLLFNMLSRLFINFLPRSQFFTSGGPSIGVSAPASLFPMNIQDSSPLQLNGWIPLQSKGLSRVFSNTRIHKHQFFNAQLFFIVQLSYSYWKNHSLD